MANYNATLEYAVNTIEFWLMDDGGYAENGFEVGTTFNIERVDGTGTPYSSPAIFEMEGGVEINTYHIEFQIEPTYADLGNESDNPYDYDNETYDHVFSVRSSTEVYLRGKLNLIKVA